MTRVLVLSHTTGYQLRAFNDAAEALGIELVFATDRCHRLDDPWQDRAIAVRFFDVTASVAAIVRRAEEFPMDGLIAVGDQPVVLAAHAAEALGIAWHSVAGATASTDKRRSREALIASGLPSPRYVVAPVGQSPVDAAVVPAYPCVVKPTGLSGSRGVIRADDERELTAAIERIRALLARPQVRAARRGLEDQILVEEYIDGREFAIEGVMSRGAFRVFAVFDKPDPLEGPFFEETIYVTPSRMDDALQRRMAEHIERAASVLGLQQGPIHAECRVTPAGEIYVLEIAARPIGGLCSRVLAFAASGEAISLERVLLEHALGRSINGYIRGPQAAAVMMIPIPQRGMYRGVSGEERARAVRGITEVRITAKEGQLLEPLPEAGSYLGFIFAKGETPADAETAVREAHRQLAFEIAKPLLANR